jgi:hypothetical protein
MCSKRTLLHTHCSRAQIYVRIHRQALPASSDLDCASTQHYAMLRHARLRATSFQKEMPTSEDPIKAGLPMPLDSLGSRDDQDTSSYTEDNKTTLDYVSHSDLCTRFLRPRPLDEVVDGPRYTW